MVRLAIKLRVGKNTWMSRKTEDGEMQQNSAFKHAGVGRRREKKNEDLLVRKRVESFFTSNSFCSVHDEDSQRQSR